MKHAEFERSVKLVEEDLLRLVVGRIFEGG